MNGKMTTLDTRASNCTCQGCRAGGLSLTGRGNAWKGVLSNRVGTVNVLLTESNDSVLRNRLARPRKKLIGVSDYNILRA